MVIKIIKNTKHGVVKITLDKKGLELYQQHVWTIAKFKHLKYLMRVTKNKSILFHRTLMGITKRNELVDHVNCDTLDNRIINLRLCTASQNLMNSRKRSNTTSKYKGVYFVKRLKRWSARIMSKSKRVHLGYFCSEHAAAIAYNIAAKKHFGEYANLNKIRKGA